MVSRQTLAQRKLLIARSAKENGAARVVLVEPDLYYSAQDRGPRRELGDTQVERDLGDLKKFDGQPFTAMLYAEILKLAGVDVVLTVHNHSCAVQTMFPPGIPGRLREPDSERHVRRLPAPLEHRRAVPTATDSRSVRRIRARGRS